MFTLREKCPNTEFFLVPIFPHSDWIRRDTEYPSVSSRNAGKYGPEKTLRIWTLFTQCYFNSLMSITLCRDLRFFKKLKTYKRFASSFLAGLNDGLACLLMRLDNFHRKTLVLDSHFIKVAGLQDSSTGLFKSSLRKCSLKKVVLRNFAKFTDTFLWILKNF